MNDFRKVLLYIDSILLPKGFKLFESEESGCIICDYRKSTNQSINSIAFLKREDKVKGFYYAVNFIEMELIIIPILTKNKLFGDVKPEKIDESFWVQKDTRYTLSDDGKDISEYEEVVNIFNLFYKQEALPFFEKWKDLNVLYSVRYYSIPADYQRYVKCYLAYFALLLQIQVWKAFLGSLFLYISLEKAATLLVKIIL